MAKAWDWQKWGTATDLIHQSDLHGVVGKFGCLEQFKRKKEERAIEGKRAHENASGKLCAGVAVHAVLHRILRSPPAVAAMLDPTQTFARSTLEVAFDEEFNRERAGRPVEWHKVNGDKWRTDCVDMLEGAVANMREHVGEVVLAEAAFVYHVDGIWLTGAIDLIYRAPGSSAISFADWKTGAQKPHPIELDHGWQSAIYSGALRDAYFIPFENVPRVDGRAHRDVVEDVCTSLAVALQAAIDDGAQTDLNGKTAHDTVAALVAKYGARTFSEFPEKIRYVHLRDFIPYAKSGSKLVDRPEELAWHGLEAPAKVTYSKGDARGPAWYHVVRSEGDAPRLRHLLRAVVSWIRFGRFPAAPGEMCSRCKFREQCLLDGYKPIGDDKKRLAQLSKQIDFDGFDPNDDEI